MATGYACPVCETPQRDATHLADHLAFTAMLRGGDHEAWLAEHAPDWRATDAEALADLVAPHAESVAHETVFDADAGAGGHDHEPGRPFDGGDAPRGDASERPLDESTRAALAEARAMTRRAREPEDAAETGDDADDKA
jgi:hypothetical protein